MMSTEKNHAIENGRGWLSNICEMVEAQRLAHESGEPEAIDAADSAINEAPLSVEVRSGWYTPGDDAGAPEEYAITLSTGGPALRIWGTLDQYGQPDVAWLQWQDWGTPWTNMPYDPETDKLMRHVLTFAQQFLF